MKYVLKVLVQNIVGNLKNGMRRSFDPSISGNKKKYVTLILP